MIWAFAGRWLHVGDAIAYLRANGRDMALIYLADRVGDEAWSALEFIERSADVHN